MVTWWLLLFLLCEPLFVNVAVWTDPWHGLFSGVKPPQMVTTYVGGLGIIFWLHTVYSYGLLMVSGLSAVFLLAEFPARLQEAGLTDYHRVICRPLVQCPYDLSTDTVAWYRFFPLGSIFSSTILAYALFRLGLFDLIPLARELVLENMTDGILIFDHEELWWI